MGSGASSRFERAAASPALFGRVIWGLAARNEVAGRPLSRSFVEWRRGFAGVCCGVPKIACLNARTANTGAGVSGGSINALVSCSTILISCDRDDCIVSRRVST